MRNRRTVRFIGLTIALAFVLAATMIAVGQNAPAAGQAGAPAAAQGGGGGGRGGAAPNPLLSQPAPKNADGTVNLGRVPGEKGIWNLPYITNMGARNVVVGAPPAPAPAAAAAPAGGGRGAAAPAAGAAAGGRGAAAPAAAGRGAAAAPAAPAAPRGRGGATSEPWVPFQPWAAAVYNYTSLNESKYDPESYCLPPGGPRMLATPYPMEIIQDPANKRVIFIYEGGAHVWREVYMDGREHPGPTTFDGSHTWLGHSVGHYEDNGQTLVIDMVGFNEGTWIDYFGHPHTEAMHIVEKYTRPNKGTLHYEAMIDDPGAYTKPWSVQWNIPWGQTGEMVEYICQGNNQYLNHLKDDYGQPVHIRQQ